MWRVESPLRSSPSPASCPLLVRYFRVNGSANWISDARHGNNEELSTHPEELSSMVRPPKQKRAPLTRHGTFRRPHPALLRADRLRSTMTPRKKGRRRHRPRRQSHQLARSTGHSPTSPSQGAPRQHRVASAHEEGNGVALEVHETLEAAPFAEDVLQAPRNPAPGRAITQLRQGAPVTGPRRIRRNLRASQPLKTSSKKSSAKSPTNTTAAAPNAPTLQHGDWVFSGLHRSDEINTPIPARG